MRHMSNSPLKDNGPGIRWLRAHINHDGKECLIWPYSRNHQGYGQAARLGKIIKANRLMCILAHGDPPTPKHHAAHSCGNGHLGCVHPRHFSWKTPQENRMESNKHGTGYGRKGKKELRPEVVLRIRNSPKSYLEIADEFGVYWVTVGKIKRGELYPNIT
jgi:hypothetical protein